MKKHNPSDGQNGQLVQWWVLVHSGPTLPVFPHWWPWGSFASSFLSWTHSLALVHSGPRTPSSPTFVAMRIHQPFSLFFDLGRHYAFQKHPLFFSCFSSDTHWVPKKNKKKISLIRSLKLGKVLTSGLHWNWALCSPKDMAF